MAIRRRYGLAAAAVLAMAAVAGVVIALLPSPGGSPQVRPPSPGRPAQVRLSAVPLGVNVAPWEGVYSGPTVSVIQPLLAAAGIRGLRYGGGSYADYYDWQTNTNIGNCLPDNPGASFTAKCASADSLSFSQFSRQASAIGAASLVTVNYGSGTPAMAAAWVAAARKNVALWEVGNEAYGCWEVDNELAGAPEHFQGFRVNAHGDYQRCPPDVQGPVTGSKTLATSYAVNALRFLRAMKAADPAVKLGVPWEMPDSGGGSAANSDEWNSTVLGTDGSYLSFVDAHYYPFSFSGGTGGGNPSDAQVLAALNSIPSLASSIRAGLAAHSPGAAFLIGETDLSSNPTTAVCAPVGAVFAAGDVLSWLAFGAQSVAWWDMDNGGNYGSCTRPDFGMFTSSATRPAPETPYYGYLLASKLAQPGATFGTLSTSAPGQVLAFQSSLPDGAHAVAFINLDTNASRAVTFATPAGLTGTLKSWAYSAGKQNVSNSTVVTGTTSAASIASGITLPPESIMVLETT